MVYSCIYIYLGTQLVGELTASLLQPVVSALGTSEDKTPTGSLESLYGPLCASGASGTGLPMCTLHI